jgi:hypothetical protein
MAEVDNLLEKITDLVAIMIRVVRLITRCVCLLQEILGFLNFF